MAFELPIMEMDFATVFTLAIDFHFRIVNEPAWHFTISYHCGHVRGEEENMVRPHVGFPNRIPFDAANFDLNSYENLQVKFNQEGLFNIIQVK